MGDQLGACHRSQIKNYFDRIRCGGWDSVGAGRSLKKKKLQVCLRANAAPVRQAGLPNLLFLIYKMGVIILTLPI